MNNFSEHLKIVLKKMCEYVGADYDTIEWKNDKDPYYWKYEWSQEQENDFREWMIDYLMDNKDARLSLLEYPGTKNKKRIKKAVNFFIWNHGWKVKDESK